MRLSNQISDQNGVVRTENYGYDELYRLTSVNYGEGQTQSYTFDPMGNRLTKVNNGVTENYSYNAANMLLTRGANNYTNDLAGNTLTGGGRTNTWDSQNRLAQCVYNGTTSTFTYASDGLRHRTVVGANTTDYVLDQSMFVREKLNGVVAATYLVGPRGPEYRRDDQSGAVRWYTCDGLGSVLGEVDANGNLTASRSFDVYGAVRTSAGTGTSKHKFVGNLGHPSEDDSGLVYMRARHMDPVTGRFLSEDSARRGANWFAYCDSDPVNRTDRNGKEAIAALIAAVFGFIFAVISAWASGKSLTEILLAGFVGAIAGAVGGLLANPAAAGFVTAALGSILNDLAGGNTPDLVKAIKLGLVGAAAGGLFGWIADKLGNSLGSQLKFVGDDVSFGDEGADGVFGALAGSFVDGTANFIID